jgi:predicted anti-sigma-YlaC factor YlaD
VQAHLAECAECRAEAERVAGAIGDFSEQSMLWAEPRSLARTVRVAEHESVLAWLLGPRSWLLRPQAWAGAALTIALAVGIGVTIEREQARTAEAVKAQARAEASKAVQAGVATTLAEAVTAQAGASTVQMHATQAGAAVQADVADQSAALKADNALLSAIDGELRADESVPASLYGLTSDASGDGTKRAKRISN